MNTQTIAIEPVTKEDIHISELYRLLQNRETQISHSNMPDYSVHSEFVRNHPYIKWYLVKTGSEYVGSFYITKQNTIGININDKDMRKIVLEILLFVNNNHKPLPAIPSVRGDRFAINVPPENVALIAVLQEIDAKILQVTYLVPKKVSKLDSERR